METGIKGEFLSFPVFAETLEKFGIPLVDEKGELRSTADVLKDIALVWDKLEEEAQLWKQSQEQ